MKKTAGILLAALLLVPSGCDDNEIEDATGGTGGTSASGGSGAGSGGGGASGGQAGSGGSAGADAASGGSAGSDAGGDASSDADPDGGGGTGGASVGCNYLTQIGTQVTSVISSAAAPVAQGGTPVDGFYALTGVTLYGGATGTTYWRTLRFVGNELKTVERDGAASADATTTGTFTITGKKLTQSLTCPSTTSYDLGFTATSTTFTAYESQGGAKLVELVYAWKSN